MAPNYPGGEWAYWLDNAMAAASIGYVLKSVVRVRQSAETLALLLVDPMLICNTHPWYPRKIESFRVRTVDGTRLLNPICDYFIWTESGTALLPAFVECELSGLGGDFALANGLSVLSWTPLSLQGIIVHRKEVGDLYLDLCRSYSPDTWLVYVHKKGNDHCWKTWSRPGDLSDPEGIYTEAQCAAGLCGNTNSCILSQGATCRIRWAGATWV